MHTTRSCRYYMDLLTNNRRYAGDITNKAITKFALSAFYHEAQADVDSSAG